MAACALRASFPADDVLFQAGDPANRFYILRSGRVLLQAERTGHAPLAIQTLEEGDVLGWSWLFPPYIWRFTARTLADVEAYFFHAAELRALAEQDPVFAAAIFPRIARVMLDRLQSTRDRIAATP